MQLKNCTPHKLFIIYSAEEPHIGQELTPSGAVPRVKVSASLRGMIGLVPISSVTYGDLEGLPSREEGVWLVCSALVAQAAARVGRTDVLSPGELVRDDRGQPLGCLGLSSPH